MNRKQRRQSQRNTGGRDATGELSAPPAVVAPKWPLEGSRIFVAGGVLLIALCTWIVYGQTIKVPPIDYDDHFYLTVSPYVAVSSPLSRLGPTWDEPYFANFHPVTTTTWLIDREFSDKGEPFDGTVFRLSHLFYAVIGAVLLIPLYRKLGIPAVLAIAGALLFAVHPIHTEVIAWLSARKDLMALIFTGLSMLAWLWARGAATPGQWRLRHTITILLVLLAVLSKPIAVIVPVLFVAYEFCSGPHAGITKWRWAQRGNHPLLTRTLALTAVFLPLAAISASLLRGLLERDPNQGGWLILVLLGCSLLILPAAPKEAAFRQEDSAGLRLVGPPFVVLSLVAGAGSAWTLWAQEQSGAIKGKPGLLQTLNAACEVVVAYLEKALVPVRMSISYSWGSIPDFSLQGFFGAVILCALLWIGFRFAGSTNRNGRLAAFGIFWFLIALIPVSNLVPTSTKMADRYLFLPTIGVILVVLAVVSAWCAGSRGRLAAAGAGLAAVVAVFTMWSYGRTEVWSGKTAMWHGQPEPDLALWSSAVAADADDSLARINLGLTYLRLDPPNIEGALTHLGRAKELIEANQSRVAGDQKLNFTPVYEGLGNAYLARASHRGAALPADPDWRAKKEDYANAVKNFQLTFLAPSGFMRGDVGILRQYSAASEALAQMDNAQLGNASGGDRDVLQRERDQLRGESEQALERARKLMLSANVPATDADYRLVVLDQGNIVFNREIGASLPEKIGDYNQALARYQEAAAAFPDDPRPLLDEGMCYERLAGVAASEQDRRQPVAQGEAALRKALTLRTAAPDYNPATPYRVLALLYLHTGDYATVLDWLRKARQAASSSADQAQIDGDIQKIEPFVKASQTRH